MGMIKKKLDLGPVWRLLAPLPPKGLHFVQDVFRALGLHASYGKINAGGLLA